MAARPRGDSILPERREDQVPPVQVAGSMRDGIRESQTQQLRETLGIVENATSGLVALHQHQQLQTETKNAEIAAGDTVNGTVNADLMAKSQAYRMVIAGGRADVALSKAEAEARVNVQQAVQASAYADPTKGEQVFGLEDANKIVEDTFRSHTLDKDGHPIDFGDPSANVRLYQGLAQVREHVLGQAAEAIKAQEQGKALDAISNTVVGGLLKGDAAAIENGMKQAGTLGLDPKETKSKLLAATLDAAMTAKSVDPITRALNSTRPDGTPTWNSQEQASLMEAQMRMRNEFEAQHRQDVENQFHTFAGQAALKVADGSLRITPAFVEQAVKSGQVDVQFSEQLLGLQHVHDEQVQQKISWGREAASYARSSVIQGMELESLKAKRQAQSFMGSALASGMSGQQLVGAILKNRRQFSSESFVDVLQFAKSLPPDDSYVKQAHAEDHLYELNNFLTASQNRWKVLSAQGAHGVVSEQEMTQKREGALYSFFSQLRLGSSPDAALQSAITSTGMSAKDAGFYVNAASARHVKNPMDVKQLSKGQ
jgi:hypothetical protein